MNNNLHSSKKVNIKYLVVIVFLLSLLTRFYNVERTARFTRDESSDLARMKSYYDDKKISFVGPISSEKDKVFSSLSYYMIMPIAAAFNFKPVGPVYGTALIGVISATLLLIAAYFAKSKNLLLTSALVVISSPLLISSRWAWNPHYVFFWISLAAVAYFWIRNKEEAGHHLKQSLEIAIYLAIGLSLGLTFHHHYVAIFTSLPLAIFLGIESIKEKKLHRLWAILAGYALSLMPYVIFDLRHPPGLFFGHYLVSNNKPHIEQDLHLGLILPNLIRNIRVYLNTLLELPFIEPIFGLLIAALAASEIYKKQWSSLKWFASAVLLLIGSIVLDDFQARYAYASIGVLYIWMFIPRDNKNQSLLATILLLILVLSNAARVPKQLFNSLSHPDMYSLTQANRIISDVVQENNLNNINIGAIASPDRDPLASKHRDLLRMNGISVREASEYDVSENLFILSTSDFETVRNDQSYSIHAFKDARLQDTFYLNDSEWIIYWLGYQE